MICSNCVHGKPGRREVLLRVRDTARRRLSDMRDGKSTRREVLLECATPLRPGARPADARTAAATVASPTPPALVGGNVAAVAERRLVASLFADLVGFTTFFEGRDAGEEVRELLSRYFEVSSDVVRCWRAPSEVHR